ncbi:MAG: GtrA family protein [Candidatus Caldarchaeum sp.]
MFRKAELARFAKFSIVGGSGVLVNMGLLYLLSSYVFGERLYMVAALISLEASILSNFVLNEVWAFRDLAEHGGVLKRMLKFHVSRAAGSAAALAILYLLTEIGFYYLFSNIVGIFIGTIVNYLTSRLWVWSPSSLPKA